MSRSVYAMNLPQLSFRKTVEKRAESRSARRTVGETEKIEGFRSPEIGLSAPKRAIGQPAPKNNPKIKAEIARATVLTDRRFIDNSRRLLGASL